MARHLRNAATRERSVLLHYHIFKNAGSTILYILERNFKDAFVNLHGVHDESVIAPEEIVDLVLADSTVSALSSHHFRYPKPSACRVAFVDVCFLRHPLGRIRSLYRYARKLNSVDWLSELARTHDEAGFVASVLEQRPNQIANWQVNYLARGGSFSHPIGPRDLEVALGVMMDIAVLGVVERFDESLVVGEFFLRWAYPDLDFAYVAQNISAPEGHRPAGQGDLLEVCRNAWGADLFEAVLALNAWDLRLHDAALGEVQRRLHSVPAYEARLAAFRARCLSLIQT